MPLLGFYGKVFLLQQHKMLLYAHLSCPEREGPTPFPSPFRTVGHPTSCCSMQDAHFRQGLGSPSSGVTWRTSGISFPFARSGSSTTVLCLLCRPWIIRYNAIL